MNEMLKVKCKNEKCKYVGVIRYISTHESLECQGCGQQLTAKKPLNSKTKKILLITSISVFSILLLVAMFFLLYEPKEPEVLGFYISSDPMLEIDQDSEYEYKITADNATKNYIIRRIETPKWLGYFKEDSSFYGVPENDDIGDHLLEFIAVDSAGDTARQSVIITVHNKNDLPILDANFPSATSDSNYEYEIQIKDDDKDDVLSVTRYVLPKWMNFNSETNVFSGVPSRDDIGKANINITISDGTEFIDYSYVIEIVKANDPPTITSKPITVIEQGSYYEYFIEVDDIDNDRVSIKAEDFPSWLKWSSRLEQLYGTPTNEDVGTHSITIHATDKFSRSNPVVQKYSIEVINKNDPPIIIANENLSLQQNESFEYSFKVEDVDLDDSVETLVLESPKWVNFDKSNLTFSGKVPSDVLGTDYILIEATDSSDESVSFKVKISISLSEEKLGLLSKVKPVLYTDKNNSNSYQNIDGIQQKLTELIDLGMINEFAMEKFNISVGGDSDPVYLVDPEDIILKGGFYYGDKCLLFSGSSGTISIDVRTDFKIHEFKEDYIFVIK